MSAIAQWARVRVTPVLRDPAHSDTMDTSLGTGKTLSSATLKDVAKMAESPLRIRRRGESPGHRQPPTSTFQNLKEEEVVWGKTPGGEGNV